MTARVSIITPVFNGKRFMEFCVKNVAEQSVPGLEHIVVDGGSKDGTVEILERLAAVHSHLRWVSEKDRGQSDAMNKGIAMATASVVSILMVDDYYEGGAIADALQHIEGQAEPTLVVGNCNVWNDQGQLMYCNKPAGIGLKNLLLGRFTDAFPMNPAAYFYHKSLHRSVGPFDTEEHFGMDLQFILGAVQHARIRYVDRVWANYRYLEGTKTYEDEKAGGNAPRVTRITESHLHRQPLHYRLYLHGCRAMAKLSRIAARLTGREGT